VFPGDSEAAAADVVVPAVTLTAVLGAFAPAVVVHPIAAQ